MFLLAHVNGLAQSDHSIALPSFTPHHRQTVPPYNQDHFYARFIARRITLEPRIRTFTLRHPDRPPDENREKTFVGAINELNAIDDVALRFSLGYRITPIFSTQLGYENLGARTMNFNNNLSDGNVRMSGPILSIRARYPVTTFFSPYVELGYAFMRARFNHDAWWTWGWSSPEAYDAAGRPQASRNNRRRFIDVTDDTGFAASIGFILQPHERISFNAEMRRLDLTAKAHAYGRTGETIQTFGKGEFPLSHNAYSFGMIFLF